MSGIVEIGKMLPGLKPEELRALVAEAVSMMDTADAKSAVDQAIEILKMKRNLDGMKVKAALKVGDRVFINTEKDKGMGPGTIERVNYTKAVVKFDSRPFTLYTVPFGVLAKVV